MAPGPTNRLAGVAGQLAGVGVPVPVHETTVQLDKPALGVSSTTEPVPLEGPELVKVTV